MSDKEDIRVIRVEDSSTEATRVLAPQIASDQETLEDGKVDVRRMTQLNPLEIMAISYFKQKKNNWIQNFLDDYMNLKMSSTENIELNRSRQIIEALGNIGSERRPDRRQRRDERSFVERHFTKRGQGPDDQ